MPGFGTFATTASTIQKWIDVNQQASGALACILPRNGDVSGSISMYRQVAQAGVLLAVEGPNEPNNWPVNYLGQYGGDSLRGGILRGLGARVFRQLRDHIQVRS